MERGRSLNFCFVTRSRGRRRILAPLTSSNLKNLGGAGSPLPGTWLVATPPLTLLAAPQSSVVGYSVVWEDGLPVRYPDAGTSEGGGPRKGAAPGLSRLPQHSPVLTSKVKPTNFFCGWKTFPGRSATLAPLGLPEPILEIVIEQVSGWWWWLYLRRTL